MKTKSIQRRAVSALLLTVGMLSLAAACGEAAEDMGIVQEIMTRLLCLAMSAASFSLVRMSDKRPGTNKADGRKGEKQ